MKFSICIPNFNYARYLGETIQSVIDQQGVDLEILVSDNASTDGSLGVIRGFADPRIQMRVNAVNVGFAGNLDRVAMMANGELMIMLSSDDLIRPGALECYQSLLTKLPDGGRRSVVSCSLQVISSAGEPTGREGPDEHLWTQADRAAELDAVAGGPVYRVSGSLLLARCLQTMKNPFKFAATCYSRDLYRAVEGYGGSRLINPDKAFHWKLLGVAETAYFIDRPLFAYRVHDANQNSQESANSALKYLVDEYVATLELDCAVLKRLELSRETVCAAFVEYDIARHGLATLARGQRGKARRILDFGRATYPDLVRGNRNALALRSLLALGPVGQKIAQRAYGTRQNSVNHSQPT